MYNNLFFGNWGVDLCVDLFVDLFSGEVFDGTANTVKSLSFRPGPNPRRT